MSDKLRHAVRSAISNQSRTSPARVLTVGDGFITAFSEIYGNIQVPYRGNDQLKGGDRILVRRAGGEKHAQFVYDGFASDSTGTAAGPGLRPEITISLPPISDHTPPTAPVGTLAHQLYEILREIRLIKGTANWDDLVGTSLLTVLTWRSPVDAVAHLPYVDNIEGDIRLVLSTKELWVWSASAWQLISGGGSGTGTATGSSTRHTVLLQTGSASVPALSCVCVLDDGTYRASAVDPSHRGRVVGIATHAAGSYAPLEVAVNGSVDFPDYTFLDTGTYVLGANGTLRSAYEPEARFVQRMGVALDHRRFVVSVGRSIQRAR